MSEYFNNFDFDALMALDNEPFDFDSLEHPVPIGQNETADYCYNATYGFDPGMDFDFNAGFQPGPSFPLLPGATATADQSCKSLLNHQATPHLPDHREVWDDSAVACAECNGTFGGPVELSQHADECQHSSYACFCGVKFARHDTLLRHLNGFTEKGARYECTFCRRHLGKQAFRRRDHLVQHLRGYHNMEQEKINDIVLPSGHSAYYLVARCHHTDCEEYKRRFMKPSDYSKHMRDVHKESDFSCPVSGCERVGAKGYMREKDLMKHLANKHPETPVDSYVRTEPLRYPCAYCGKWLSDFMDCRRHESECWELHHK
ncbi:hypothetical protein GQX73_g8523 [Xylaria multiplex]|uniref:C2H2-type domain-containing protein n=1 Tax=Xylaria multiplex TaxID=323545 RepID=A0A7C8IJD5_9PEZI|nr:hypothetical protein GQX73_g8523 [Xylaria multiplex]